MKGTEVNSDQLSSARDFITEFVTHQPAPADPEQRIEIRWHELVRLVAWYGALRARGIENGRGGTVDKPGELVNRAASEASAGRSRRRVEIEQ